VSEETPPAAPAPSVIVDPNWSRRHHLSSRWSRHRGTGTGSATVEPGLAPVAAESEPVLRATGIAPELIPAMSPRRPPLRLDPSGHRGEAGHLCPVPDPGCGRPRYVGGYVAHATADITGTVHSNPSHSPQEGGRPRRCPEPIVGAENTTEQAGLQEFAIKLESVAASPYQVLSRIILMVSGRPSSSMDGSLCRTRERSQGSPYLIGEDVTGGPPRGATCLNHRREHPPARTVRRLRRSAGKGVWARGATRCGSGGVPRVQPVAPVDRLGAWSCSCCFVVLFAGAWPPNLGTATGCSPR